MADSVGNLIEKLQGLSPTVLPVIYVDHPWALREDEIYWHQVGETCAEGVGEFKEGHLWFTEDGGTVLVFPQHRQTTYEELEEMWCE